MYCVPCIYIRKYIDNYVNISHVTQSPYCPPPPTVLTTSSDIVVSLKFKTIVQNIFYVHFNCYHINCYYADCYCCFGALPQ